MQIAILTLHWEQRDGSVYLEEINLAIKKRFVECECGEIFAEGSKNSLMGNIAYGPWKLKGNRLRNTKSDKGCDILIAVFERSVGCGKCNHEMMREKRQYELTPPINNNDADPISSYTSREFVLRSASVKTDSRVVDEVTEVTVQ